MAKEKKSYNLMVEMPDGIGREEMISIVERASQAVGLYNLAYRKLLTEEVPKFGSLAF